MVDLKDLDLEYIVGECKGSLEIHYCVSVDGGVDKYCLLSKYECSFQDRNNYKSRMFRCNKKRVVVDGECD